MPKIKPNSTQSGLGLRQDHLDDFIALKPKIDFLEMAPENWMNIGGKLGKKFSQIASQYQLVAHGISLSLGGPSPLSVSFLKELKKFLKKYRIQYYSEHLSYCGDHAQLYDLLPLPFHEESIKHCVKRIKQCQDILEQKIAIENISYYLTPPHSCLSETQFINAILKEADCRLLLDVNNVYVNSINQNYNAKKFIEEIPSKRIAYLHVAGHLLRSPTLLIDTHGSDVADPVWDLLRYTYQCHGQQPTLLERDFNLPKLKQLLSELKIIQNIQSSLS